MRTNYILLNTNILVTKKQGETLMKETLTFQIEKELKIELKVLAVRQEKTLTQLLNEVLTDYVNENK